MSLTDRLRKIEARITAVESGATVTKAAGQIVIEVQKALSPTQRAHMQEAIAAALEGTGQRALVLDGGARLARPTDEQVEALRQDIARVEGKLDALLDALAQEGDGDEDQAPGLTLDGDDAGGERDQSQEL